MAQFLEPSSFKCDCGTMLEFCESTIKEMREMSKNKQASLGYEKHSIIFKNGQAIKIRCPKLKLLKIKNLS